MITQKPFFFKEFTIHQEKAAMKVGTDGVLLGAWCSLDHHPETILDIGSGTGLIALMIAQRSNAITIDAVEINEEAYEESVENFERSDWSDRLFCYHSSFQDFVKELKEEEETYDLIISNPPFYSETFDSINTARNTARFTASLSFQNLITGTAEILSQTGIFAVIVPRKEEQAFVSIALESNLFLVRVCRVKGHINATIKRSLLEFSFQQKPTIAQELVIETARHQYTTEYTSLVKDFYLKM